MLVIFDTNIFIYASQGKLELGRLQGLEVGHASVTRIEALGYWNIGAYELNALQRWLDESLQFELDSGVVARAVALRQICRIGLGDAIVAATALENQAELWTANVADFAGIEGLRLHNPLAM